MMSKVKKVMPILASPGVRLLGYTMEEVLNDGAKHAECVDAIAKRYDIDMAMMIMDLTLEAEVFGASIKYSADGTPDICEILIRNEADAEKLIVPSPYSGRCKEYIRAVKLAKEKIHDRPVYAGIIGPYSLAARLADVTEIMVLCYEEPELVETILEKATQFLIEYAGALKKAGADGVIIAEPVAGLLSPKLFEKFALPYGKKLIRTMEEEDMRVIYHNCGPIEPIWDSVKKMQASVYSIGNVTDIKKILEKVPKEMIVMGNLDPVAVFQKGTPQTVKDETRRIIENCGQYQNFVLSSGCDIPADTPMANLDAFFEEVGEWIE